jgi:hypothetical protein
MRSEVTNEFLEKFAVIFYGTKHVVAAIAKRPTHFLSMMVVINVWAVDNFASEGPTTTGATPSLFGE